MTTGSTTTRGILYQLAILSSLVCYIHCATVWPKPLQESTTEQQYHITEGHFAWKVGGFDSDILQDAIDRYDNLLFKSNEYAQGDSNAALPDDVSRGKKHNNKITELNIYVASNDQSLNLQTDESYVLEIEAPTSSLSANTVFGALHGLETFSQLPAQEETQSKALDSMQESQWSLSPASSLTDDEDDGPTENGDDLEKHKKKHRKKHKKHKKHHKKHHKKARRHYTINGTSIWDAPRFAHRGLLIDTARHFLPVTVIMDHLEAMSSSKMNVLHWHIVDDQSFPFVSNSLPLLAQKGAFSPDLVYTPEDVQEVITYAKSLGIRVIPEFDTPGHTLSWGNGYPRVLADCYDKQGKPLGTKGPMNPASNETYELLWTLLLEVAAVFPDMYIHLGGDEVPFGCWQNNPEITEWRKSQNPAIQNMSALEEYFERRVLDLAASAGRSYIVWQEILDNNVQIQDDTVVHVWKWWWPTDDPPTPPPLLRFRKLLSNMASLHPFPEIINRLGGLFGRASRDEMEPLLESKSEPDRQGQCQLSSGCMPDLQHGKEADDTPGWVKELERVTLQGYRTLLSSPWYLNLGGFASSDWTKYYSVEPQGFQGSEEQHQLVIGGEACMWGEFVDKTNAISRTWPRAAAVAERLWSNATVRPCRWRNCQAIGQAESSDTITCMSIEEAWPRLEEHRCRLNARGIAAEPLGPGFCH